MPSRASLFGLLVLAGLLAGCSVSGPRESPINAVTKGSPTVLDIYRGQGEVDTQTLAADRASARDRLLSASAPRPVQEGDADTQRYWSALEPMRNRFARVPNPDLVMVVFPHLARGQYPVPGYVTVFPMYEQANLYALPGEVELELVRSHAPLRPAAKKEGAAK
jgi:conjugative transfer region lipoprotein (TIGR03751 family)